MDKAIQSLYQELLRDAQRYRVSNVILSRLSRKMKKAKLGKAEFSEVIFPLIQEIKNSIRRNTRDGDRESALISMERKRTRFCEFQKELIYKGKY